MEIQIVLPNESAAMEPHVLVDLVRRAEDLGYGAVWLPDHLLPPHGQDRTYGGVHEPLVTLAHLGRADGPPGARVTMHRRTS